MSDQFWQTLRYVLIGVGGFFAGRGKLDPSAVAPLADQIVQIGSGTVALAAAVWGLYVRFQTATVPAAVGARPDVPTVSSASGVIKT